MQLTLRNSSPGDFETLYAIDQACYPRGIAYSRRILKCFLALEGAACVVAQMKQEPKPLTVGFIIAEADRSEGHIVTLDVVGDHRRAGVGTALLREMERRLAAQGIQRVSLEAAVSNDAAVSFWQRHGYRSVGRIRGYYLGRIDAFEMTKSLVTFP